MWIRQLLTEINLGHRVAEPTKIYSDSITAIDWAKFGKITPGNNCLALGYRHGQIQEWIASKHIELVKIMIYNKVSDFGTTPVDKPVVDRLLKFYTRFLGELSECVPAVTKKNKKTMEMQVAWLQEFGLEKDAAEEHDIVRAYNFRLQQGRHNRTGPGCRNLAIPRA